MKFDQNSAEAVNVNFLQPLDDFASSVDSMSSTRSRISNDNNVIIIIVIVHLIYFVCIFLK